MFRKNKMTKPVYDYMDEEPSISDYVSYHNRNHKSFTRDPEDIRLRMKAQKGIARVVSKVLLERHVLFAFELSESLQDLTKALSEKYYHSCRSEMVYNNPHLRVPEGFSQTMLTTLIKEILEAKYGPHEVSLHYSINGDASKSKGQMQCRVFYTDEAEMIRIVDSFLQVEKSIECNVKITI